MSGTVYIFNAIPQPVMLTVNNQASKTVKIPGDISRPYVPFTTQTTRSDPNLGGLFTNGIANSVSIQYQGGQVQVNVNIPSAATSTPGLWLYLFADRVILFDTSGKMLEQDLLNWSFETQILINGEFPDEELPDQELCG